MSSQTENPLESPRAGSLFRVLLRVAQALKFPSVKAQEFMMGISDFGEVREMKPDLFDPSLDESNRQFEFHLFSGHGLSELQNQIQSAQQTDPEIQAIFIEAFPEPKKLREVPAAETIARQVRVDSRRLDELNRLAGELVILKEQVSSVATDLSRFSKYPELLEFSKSLRRSVHGIHEVAGQIQNRTREFQQVPIGSLLQRFQRLARDTSRALNKPMECVIEGAETEIDGAVLERVGDLLVHLVRNAADHGLESPEERKRLGKPETGRIALVAYPEENYIIIEATDDGRGIDPKKVAARALKLGMIDEAALAKMPESEIIKFIFRSGFSTTDGVSEVSGRGVGLDVVKSRTEELNGLLDFRTELGKGTTFSIRLPVSVSIVQSLLIEVEQEVYALPLVSILRVLKLGKSEIDQVEKQSQIHFADELLSTWFLRDILKKEKSDAAPAKTGNAFLIELGYGVERYGLVVDRVVGRREIVIRPLSQALGPIDGLHGTASLGDGTIVVVLDPRLLFEKRIK